MGVIWLVDLFRFLWDAFVLAQACGQVLAQVLAQARMALARVSASRLRTSFGPAASEPEVEERAKRRAVGVHGLVRQQQGKQRHGAAPQPHLHGSWLGSKGMGKKRAAAGQTAPQYSHTCTACACVGRAGAARAAATQQHMPQAGPRAVQCAQPTWVAGDRPSGRQLGEAPLREAQCSAAVSSTTATTTAGRTGEGRGTQAGDEGQQQQQQRPAQQS